METIFMGHFCLDQLHSIKCLDNSYMGLMEAILLGHICRDQQCQVFGQFLQGPVWSYSPKTLLSRPTVSSVGQHPQAPDGSYFFLEHLCRDQQYQAFRASQSKPGNSRLLVFGSANEVCPRLDHIDALLRWLKMGRNSLPSLISTSQSQGVTDVAFLHQQVAQVVLDNCSLIWLSVQACL